MPLFVRIFVLSVELYAKKTPVMHRVCRFMVKQNAHKKYAGMTVNERLYEAGLIEEFDKARKAKDRAALVNILVKTGLTEGQANKTDSILK